MAKNLLQDMVRVKSQNKKVGLSRPVPNLEREIISYDIKRNKKGSKYRIYLVALISVIFLLFALSFLFSGAKITIVPKIKDVPINDNIAAEKNGSSLLPFDLVVISGEEKKSIEVSGEKDVAIKAEGNVVIYNSFSSSPQIFNTDTKLEGTNGKIYKTNKKVIVPGMTKSGKPGSVEVGIYATEAGKEYNSLPIDFKILSLKGTTKYFKIYGRSKGEITGGLKGKSPVISDLDKVTAVSELKSMMESKLLKKVTDQIPSGFILFKDAVFLDINDKNVSFVPDKDNTVSVNVKGTLYGFLFDEKKLTKKIVQDVIEKYDDSEVYIPNIRELNFSLIDKENILFSDVKNINFTLSGTPKIIWKVDESKFITDILGKKKSDFNLILSQYPSIDTTQLVIRPFWKASFPEQTKNIEVIVNYPK